MLTWVVLDLFILVRGASQPDRDPDDETEQIWNSPQVQAKGLSLVGALLLLIGLLPAGPTGPSQPLQGGRAAGRDRDAHAAGRADPRRHLSVPSVDFARYRHSALTWRNGCSTTWSRCCVGCGCWAGPWNCGADYILLQPDLLFVLMLCFPGQRHRRVDRERPAQSHDVRADHLGGVGRVGRGVGLSPGTRGADLADDRVCAGRCVVAGGRPGVADVGLADPGQRRRAGAWRACRLRPAS